MKRTTLTIFVLTTGALGYLAGATLPVHVFPAFGAQTNVGAPTTMQAVSVSEIYINASSVKIGPRATEIILDLGVLKPDVADPKGIAFDSKMRCYMVPSAAKEMSLILNEVVQTYEKQFGNIQIGVPKKAQ